MIIRAINLPEGSETPFFAAFPLDYSDRTPLLARLFRMYSLRAGAIQHSQSQLNHASLWVHQPYHRAISIYNPYSPAHCRFNFGHNLLFIRDTLNLWQQSLTKVSFDKCLKFEFLAFLLVNCIHPIHPEQIRIDQWKPQIQFLDREPKNTSLNKSLKDKINTSLLDDNLREVR